MSKIDNSFLPPNIRWLIFVIAASIAPPVIRIFICILSVDDVDYFWESETDMIASCLAISIAFFAELNSPKKKIIPGTNKIVALLFVIIPILLFLMYTALNYDYQKEMNNEKHIEVLHNIAKNGSEQVLFQVLSLKDKIQEYKLILYFISTLFAIAISSGSYWFLYKKGGENA